jgi:hypothetical protein
MSSKFSANILEIVLFQKESFSWSRSTYYRNAIATKQTRVHYKGNGIQVVVEMGEISLGIGWGKTISHW